MTNENITIIRDYFGRVPKSNCHSDTKYETVKSYTMTNEHNASVRVITWGARVQSVNVPDKEFTLGDVVLGYDSLSGYLKNRYVGSMIGRVADRIPDGKLNISGHDYSLTLNDKEHDNHFNGGFCAFDNVNWDSYILYKKQVVMSLLSKAGSEGYPGFLLTQVKFSWTNENKLHIDIRATTTEPTPVNITNYCLFNLAGHGMGPSELMNHVVTLNADSFVGLDLINKLPDGSINCIDRTIFDLRKPTQLSRKKLFSLPGGGYDNYYCISCPSVWCYRFHARIVHPRTERTLEVYSNHPGLYFFTANDFPDFDTIRREDESNKGKSQKKVFGKDGICYRRHGGFILSPQNYPNAVNIKNFPECILYPGQVYKHDITYKFGLYERY